MTGFVGAWHQWHRDRVAAMTAPFGPAALVVTESITATSDQEAQEVEGAPGRWYLQDEGLIGVEVPGSGGSGSGGELRLAAGESRKVGSLLLRAHPRSDGLTLRVFDPDKPQRLALRDIQAFDPDPAWAFPARFLPGEEAVEVHTVDGLHQAGRIAGRVVFDYDGAERAVSVSGSGDRLQAVIADATSGTESYRFRFLPIPAPDAAGNTVIDFNRAILPPCAFSDQFSCPFPPEENILDLPVRAGERFTVLDAGAGSA